MKDHASHGDRHRRDQLISVLWWTVFGLVIAGLIGYIVWDIFRPLAGTRLDVLQRTHVPESDHPEYNSNPPTSGAHYDKTEEWGIYDKPLVKERLVHNLEHGGILIYYKCEKCEDLVSKLSELTKRLAKKDRKIILVPSTEIDATIVLTAWGWLDKMNEYDEKRIRAFFNDHINRGPERVL